MATTIKTSPEANMREAAETWDMLLPLLDRSDAAVKELIPSAKKRGYVTVDQINFVLPSKEANSERRIPRAISRQPHGRQRRRDQGGRVRGRWGDP